MRLSLIFSFVGICFAWCLCAMEEPSSSRGPVATWNVGMNEQLAIQEVDPVMPLQERNKVFVIAAALYERDTTDSSTNTTPTGLSSVGLGGNLKKEEQKIATVDENVGTDIEASDTFSDSSEHISAEFELGKKGSWFHCRTHCKSKTIAKYSATAIGGIIAGLLL